MNIIDLLGYGEQVSITISPRQLEEFALSIIAKVKEEQQREQQPESYMTPDEVARVFNVTKNTLWRWDRLNYLKPVRCGRRLHYKRSDIENLLNGGNAHTDEEKGMSNYFNKQNNCRRKGGRTK